jgi:hypothetical protein
MKLIPVKKELEENQEFLQNPLCADSLQMTIDFYKKVGFLPGFVTMPSAMVNYWDVPASRVRPSMGG